MPEGPRPSGDVFFDVSAQVGLDFDHFNGMSGEFYFVEMTGQGAAFFDFDDDGDLDVYLVQGAALGPAGDRSSPSGAGSGRGDRLLRNDLSSRTARSSLPHFVDVTASSGIEALGYGMGVATGDYNNDGRMDIYVTNFGPNQLWRNDGDGKFSDVTLASGSDDPAWSTSASFFDFDRDGWLDLYVVNYVDFSLERNVLCYAESSRRDYCGPHAFTPVRDRLLRNRRDGTFEDVSAQSALARNLGAGLGVVSTDVNADGWPDLYVANDGMANQLWLNQADGTFRDEALLAGAAVNRQGRPEASMGVAAGDFDGDGDEDLFLTHLGAETNTLFVNDGSGLFEDRSVETGLGGPSLAYTSFGTAWLDFDHDGWLDLFVANGAVRVLEPLVRAGNPFPLDQTNQLFRNLAGAGFDEITDQAGAAFKLAEVSRGAAFGDVDNDGDTDVLVLNNNSAARLLENRVGSRQPWLGLRLVGRDTNRDMLGARVALERSRRPALWRRVRTDGSYCSAHDPRVVFGLENQAGTDSVTAVRVEWPDGQLERWPSPAVGRYTTLRQGTGTGIEPAE